MNKYGQFNFGVSIVCFAQALTLQSSFSPLLMILGFANLAFGCMALGRDR